MFNKKTVLIITIIGMFGLVSIWGLKLLPFSEAKTPPARAPEAEEQSAQAALANSLPGRIVFDSNRSGRFGIYSSKLDGSDLKTLSDTEKHEIYPDASPKGDSIVFARTGDLGRDADAEVILLDLKTGSERVLAAGTFPSFSADGTKVFFEVKRTFVMEIALEEGSQAKEIFPAGNADFQSKKVVKPRISNDEKRLYFTSDHGGRWTAWAYDLLTDTPQKIGKGCEPAPYSNQTSAAWVTKKNVLAKSAIARRDSDGKMEVIQDDGKPYGHEYFPTLVENDKFLFYSACPAGQHSHYEANYQLFVRDLSKEKAVRVTFDEYTNRWPKYLP